MRRTGNPWTAILSLAATIAVVSIAAPAGAEEGLEFYQMVDRKLVGTSDTFTLSVFTSVGDEGELRLPASNKLEVLNRAEGTQMSIQMGGNGRFIKRTRTYELTMRAKRTGTLVIPPAQLKLKGKVYRTKPITLKVVAGHAPGATSSPARPGNPLDDLDQPFGGPPRSLRDLQDRFGLSDEMSIPRSDSDLFLKATLDKQEVFVGEQATYTVYIFSRVDLASVDAVVLPKLEGFWSEDLENPSQLTPQEKTVQGVPYRVYLLKRRALFPVTAGNLEVSPAEADITSGFVFAGHKLHRKSNGLKLKVKPLPPGGPPSAGGRNVGSWKLSTESSAPEVELGTPVTVKVSLEGTGNFKNVELPRIKAPPNVRVYDPTATDKPMVKAGRFGGRRTQEYLVSPQSTGAFTLPGLRFDYFDPSAGQYKLAETEPIRMKVVPGEGGTVDSVAPSAGAPKNVLAGGGLRPLLRKPHFGASSRPLWSERWFWPAVAVTPLAWLGLALAGALQRTRQSRIESPEDKRRRKARGAAARLKKAESLKKGRAGEFYGEVERALGEFLEARLKLELPFSGLTRDALAERMRELRVPPPRQTLVLRVLERCDAGRFAPGESGTDRDSVLQLAATAMEGWE